ncbi:hypothetical protein FMM75_15210 [Lachnospiraceae bacterium MD335]|nr:hypothetical protein [Lachnospiraceae bacterium MD335]
MENIMKHCIAVTEILTRIVTVDTKEDGEDSLEKVFDRVEDAYYTQEIILDANDLVPDQITGKSASFSVADWIEPDEIQKRDADFIL